MAEAKGSAALLTRSIQKTFGRTKAKVLQSLGKADKTTDEIFKSYVGNFERQQQVAGVLQKELKHYLQCVKGMTVAAKNLYETILQEVYEPEWTEQIMLANSVKSLDMLYANYEAELNDRVYSDLLGYLGRFPDFKEKISKRSRKLLDYDNARHEYEAVQNAKKKDDVKISKTRETLSEARHTYEELNTELHRELPEFFDHRVAFSAANLNALFRTESTFHLESGKIMDQLSELANRLATEFSEGMHRLKIPASAVLTREPTIDQQGLEGSGSCETGNEYATLQEDNPVDLSTLSVQSRPDATSNSDAENDAAPPSSAVVNSERAPSGGSVKLPQRPSAQPKNRAPSVKVATGSAAVPPSSAEGGAAAVYSPLATCYSATSAGSSEPVYAQLLTCRSPTAPPPPPPPGHVHPQAVASAPSSNAGRSSASGELQQQQQEPDVVSRPSAATDRSNAGNVRVSANGSADDSAAAATGAAAAAAAITGSGQRQGKSGAEKDGDQPATAASANGLRLQQHPVADGSVTLTGAADDVTVPSVAVTASAAVPLEQQPPAKDKVRQVVATHAYTAEDDDELTFEPGEIITLIPFDDPEDQDEGWEMGIKVTNGLKGVFPANFTRPL